MRRCFAIKVSLIARVQHFLILGITLPVSSAALHDIQEVVVLDVLELCVSHDTCISVDIKTWTIDFEESQYWCGSSHHVATVKSAVVFCPF